MREDGLSAARVLERCGLLSDSHDYHLKRFLHEFFPRGTAFPPHEVPRAGEDLPRAALEAFSLDDIGTTEIDDAFSVQRCRPEPASASISRRPRSASPGSALDAIARERLSTAYMPGRKFTMLPEDVIERSRSITAASCPAVSLYVDLDADLRCALVTRASSACRSSPTCATPSTTSSTKHSKRRKPKGSRSKRS